MLRHPPFVLPAAASLLGGVAVLLAHPACAAGIWLVETGGSDMGMAGAGRAALALDAASAVANPANLQALPQSSVTVAAVPLELDYRFEGTDGFDARATNHEGATVLPAAYAAWRRDRVSVGFGAHSHFGLSYDSGTIWGGERAVERAGLATYDVGPSVALGIDDQWTVGASVTAQFVRTEMHLAVANDAIYYGPPAGFDDGQMDFRGDDWSAGAQLGATWSPSPETRVGLAWTAPVGHTTALDVEGRGLHPVLATLVPPDGAARLDFRIPQQLLLGVSREHDATTLACGLAWQDWSQFGDARLRLAGQHAPIFPGGLRDTWGASLGLRHTFDDRWTASGGIGYESSPAPTRGVPIYFPVAEQWRIAAGVERAFNEDVTLRASLSVVFQGDAEVLQTQHPLPLPGIPQFTGRYEDTHVYALGLAADFRL